MNVEFYKFLIFVPKTGIDQPNSKAVVGAAYLREGHRMYTLRLWMFQGAKFYLMPDKQDQTKLVIFTREAKRDPSIGKGKYFWNAIGSGQVDTNKDVVRLEFDLLEKPIFMSIFPSKPHEITSVEVSEMMDAS